MKIDKKDSTLPSLYKGEGLKERKD